MEVASTQGANLWLSIVASVSTIVLFALTIGRWVWKRFMNAVLVALQEINSRSKRVETQVTPNGGNTNQLGDMVLNLRKELDLSRQETRALSQRVDRIDGQSTDDLDPPTVPVPV